MKSTSKKRTPPAAKQRRPPKPTSAQVFRQLGIILLVVIVWVVLLVGWLSLTGASGQAEVAPPQPTEAVAEATATEPPAPADTATATEEATATGQPATATATEPGPTETGAPELTATATEPPPAASDTPAAEPTATEPTAGGVSFAAEVLPLLKTRCERCHGEQRAERGLKLTSYADVMAGSQNGPVVVPGSAATSRLVELIVSGEMPRRSPRLPESEIQTISTWVDQGALDN